MTAALASTLSDLRMRFAPLTGVVPVAPPIVEASIAAPSGGELSDDDLEHVVGGLARTFMPGELPGPSTHGTNAGL